MQNKYPASNSGNFTQSRQDGRPSVHTNSPVPRVEPNQDQSPISNGSNDSPASPAPNSTSSFSPLSSNSDRRYRTFHLDLKLEAIQDAEKTSISILIKCKYNLFCFLSLFCD